MVSESAARAFASILMKFRRVIEIRPRNARFAISILGCAGLVGMPFGSASAQELTVPPGTVVRWLGSGVEECSLGTRNWWPIGDECWYPIDLLTPEGTLELARQINGQRQVRQIRVGSYPYEVQHINLQDDSQVNLSAEDLARVQRENRKIGALWSLESPRRFELPLSPPLDPLPPSGRFGARRFFNDQPRSPHSGADFKAQAGTSVKASAEGIVALIGDFFFSGKSVFVDHGDGLISMCFHLSEIAVEEGAWVNRGDLLGRVGATGRATGPHLHFGVRWHQARIDPRLLLEGGSSVQQVP